MGLRCGIDFRIPSLCPLWITLLLALLLGCWALTPSTETLILNISAFTKSKHSLAPDSRPNGTGISSGVLVSPYGAAVFSFVLYLLDEM